MRQLRDKVWQEGVRYGTRLNRRRAFGEAIAKQERHHQSCAYRLSQGLWEIQIIG
ncbi:MAG: hypothetical protein KME12_17890 [Trichocoleus desertorum ATA4-8-CV12]|nr:hypothetical protein [Trichocoleus desertorum ATA4-8-CV12]